MSCVSKSYCYINVLCGFRKPSGSASKGVYELKDESLKEYSPFFYHYSRADQSKVIQGGPNILMFKNGMLCVGVNLTILTLSD